MEPKTVEEIMVAIRYYPHIPDMLKLEEAMVVLKMKRWEIKTRDGRLTVPHSALVFDKDLAFTGIVRRHDILRGLLPGFLAGESVHHRESLFPMAMDLGVSELSYDRALESMSERAQRRISEVMSPIRTTVAHNAHLMTAMQKLVECDRTSLPVVKEDRIIGMLRSADVLHEIEMFLNIKRRI